MNSFFTFAKRFQQTARKIIFYSILLLIVIITSGCGPSAGFFSVVPNDQNIKAKDTQYSLPDGNTFNETEYTFPQSVKIEEVDYDDSSKTYFVKYTTPAYPKNEYGFMIYDIAQKKILWNAESNMQYGLMRINDLVLKDPIGYKLYDINSGKFIRNMEDYTYFLNDGRTLLLSEETFALIDIRTGEKIWQRPGHDWEGVRQEYLNGDWCYVIAEGLHALNLKEGEKWEYLTSTSYTEHGKEIATEVGLSCLFALGGMTRTAPYNPDVTTNMNSTPLVVDDVVYFAARDKMAALDKLSGKLIWETNIDPELERMEVYNLSDNEVALIGLGRKFINRTYKPSDPPTLRTIRKEDAKITGFFELEQQTIVQDFASNKGNIYLLTPKQLIVFDKDLRLLGKVEAKKEYGNFTNLLWATDTLVIRTSKGLAGISNDSFEEEWFQYCELPPIYISEEWIKPLYEHLKINQQSLFKFGYYWTPNENNGLTAYNFKNGEEVIRVNLYGNNLKVFDHKYYIDFKENKIKFISFE
jgi:outer membrane protein assembly factor BamB